MKKLFLGAAIAMSSLTFAQQFGAKAGLNVSSTSKDANLEDQKAKVGFHAGVFANIPLAASFSVQPEVLYSQYGNKTVDQYSTTIAGVTTGYKDTYTTSLDYVTVPVMFQYKPIPALYLEAGPEFGFLVSAKNKGEEVKTLNNASTTTSFNNDIKKNLNTFNAGLGIGAGYYFTENIGVSARYVAGLTDVVKDNNGDAIKNNVFQAGINFKF